MCIDGELLEVGFVLLRSYPVLRVLLECPVCLFVGLGFWIGLLVVGRSYELLVILAEVMWVFLPLAWGSISRNTLCVFIK